MAMVVDAIDEAQRKVTVANALFSIVIPTWNNLAYLQLCIESIRKNSTHQHQIIVHINEGSDGTINWVQQQSDISYCYSKQNIGVCFALNACRRLVATNYFLYINDDMYVCPDWDAELYKDIKSIGHNNFFISATAIEPKASSSAAIEKNYGTSIETFDEKKLLQEYKTLPFGDWSGASWPPNIVHIDVWDLVGGYSIEFSPGMYSDPDFAMKLWLAGIRYFKGVSASRVYHFGSISVKRITHNKGYYTFISKWAITQNIFSKNFLHKGTAFQGYLKEPQLSVSKKLNVYFKRFKAIFKSGYQGE